MLNIPEIQAALTQFGLDGWLLYDFRGSNQLARRVLQLDTDAMTSRRFFYFVPARGEPRKLVHRIESGVLDHLPGELSSYLTWQELQSGVESLVEAAQHVAMEYSPRASNPYVSRVDAGTVELVQSMATEVVSSGDLIQQFEATWDDRQWALHLEAAQCTDEAFRIVWQLIADRVRANVKVSEIEAQAAILECFSQHGLVTSHPPIVAVGPHSGDPHFEPNPDDDTVIGQGDFVLVDLWGKKDCADAVYSDLTRVAYVGSVVPDHFEKIFQLVAQARDAAIELVRQRFSAGAPLAGWEVDQAAREVIDAAGYGDFFIHRTGHSIGTETHGNGANMDNLEMHDERRVLPRTCFSIEPGIYLSDFGIRSEVNVFVDESGKVQVTGGELQRAVIPLLAP